MSGGSFDYLYLDSPLPPGTLRRMAEEAEEEGLDGGARALRRLINHYIALEEDWEKVAGFMRAFEWWRSGDYGKEQVKEAELEIDLPDRLAEALAISLSFIKDSVAGVNENAPPVTYLHDPQTGKPFACVVNFELFDKLTRERPLWNPMNHDHIEAEMADEWPGTISDSLREPLAELVAYAITEFLDEPKEENAVQWWTSLSELARLAGLDPIKVAEQEGSQSELSYLTEILPDWRDA